MSFNNHTHMIRRTVNTVFILICLGTINLGAEELSSHNHEKKDTTITAGFEWESILSTKLDMQTSIIPKITIEAEFGSVQIRPQLDLTPITLKASALVSYTLPIPVLTFHGGAGLGTGWQIDSTFAGIGIQPPDETARNYEPESFSRLMHWEAVGATFQFDLGEIIPGEWNHIVFQSQHEFRHVALTGIDDNTVWQFETIEDQRNGWRYRTSSFIGYQMPIFFNMVGLLLETETMISDRDLSPQADGGWGSDSLKLTPGLLLSFQFSPKVNLLLLGQWEIKPNYLSGDENLNLYNRSINTETPLTLDEAPKATLILNITL